MDIAEPVRLVKRLGRITSKYIIIDAYNHAFSLSDTLLFLYSSHKAFRELVVQNYRIVKNSSLKSKIYQLRFGTREVMPISGSEGEKHMLQRREIFLIQNKQNLPFMSIHVHFTEYQQIETLAMIQA